MKADDPEFGKKMGMDDNSEDMNDSDEMGSDFEYSGADEENLKAGQFFKGEKV